MTVRTDFNLEPWARQPGEGAKPFAAFQMYRDQPPMNRSVRRVGEAIRRTRTIVGRWSSQWSWVARAAAWDAEQDRLIRAENIKERQAFARRLAASGALMQARGLGKLRSYIDRFDHDGQPVELRQGQHFVDDLSIPGALRLIDVGARLEGVGRGLPSLDEVEAPAPQTFVANPIIEALTTDPSRTPQVIAAIRDLVALPARGAPAELEPNISGMDAMDAEDKGTTEV